MRRRRDDTLVYHYSMISLFSIRRYFIFNRIYANRGSCTAREPLAESGSDG